MQLLVDIYRITIYIERRSRSLNLLLRGSRIDLTGHRCGGLYAALRVLLQVSQQIILGDFDDRGAWQRRNHLPALW